MATDIYNMLTGGYNPEDERRQQQQAFDKNLSQTTNPQAFIASVMSNMGSQIGQGVSSALGMPNKQQKIQKIMQTVGNISDPLGQAKEAYKLFQQEGMVQEAQKVLQSIKGLQKEQDTFDQTASLANIDFNSSDAVFEAGKKALQSGDRAGGLSLMQQAKQLKADEDKTTARTAVVNRRMSGIKARNPEMPVDFIPLVANEDDLFKEWYKAKEEKNNVSYQVVGNKKIMYVTDSAGNIVNQLELGSAPAVANTTVDIGGVFQQAYDKEDAKTAAEEWSKEGAKYRTNANTLVRLKELRPELQKAYTGQFGEAKLVVAKSLQALGLPVNVEAITTTEQLKAATSQFVQAIAKTFPGSQSNKELDQLIASTPNIMQIMPTIIKKMVEIERELVAQQATYKQMDDMPQPERAKANSNRMYVDNLKSTRRYYSLLDKQSSPNGVSKAEIAEAIKLQQELGVD